MNAFICTELPHGGGALDGIASVKLRTISGSKWCTSFGSELLVYFGNDMPKQTFVGSFAKQFFLMVNGRFINAVVLETVQLPNCRHCFRGLVRNAKDVVHINQQVFVVFKAIWFHGGLYQTSLSA
jgi:protein gp37